MPVVSIKFQSNDGIEFPISHEVARISEYLVNDIEENQDSEEDLEYTLVLHTFDSNCTALLVDFMNHHANDPVNIDIDSIIFSPPSSSFGVQHDSSRSSSSNNSSSSSNSNNNNNNMMVMMMMEGTSSSAFSDRQLLDQHHYPQAQQPQPWYQNYLSGATRQQLVSIAIQAYLLGIEPLIELIAVKLYMLLSRILGRAPTNEEARAFIAQESMIAVDDSTTPISWVDKLKQSEQQQQPQQNRTATSSNTTSTRRRV